MAESTIRAAIASILGAVTNIGKVHDRERWSTDWSKFIAFFKTRISGADQIRGWEIGRRAPISETGDDTRTHTYSIKGYLGVDDGAQSEKTFSALIEDVAAAFRTNKTLNGAALGHDFIQVETLDTRSFGGVLCHYAELTLTVYEFIG